MIPAWQSQALYELALTEQLSWVPYNILEAIDLAESGGQGGFVNQLGYGGFFGLRSGYKYPGGVLTLQELQGTDPADFDLQAQITASEFAYLLGLTYGNIYAAEQMYQGGSSEGTNIMKSMGIPENIPWPAKPLEGDMYFSWENNTYFVSGGTATLLTKNALVAVNNAVAIGKIYVIPDVEAGLYNTFVAKK